MAGGTMAVNFNSPTVDSVSSSANVENTKDLSGTSFKDAIKNATEKNNSKTDKDSVKTNNTENKDDENVLNSTGENNQETVLQSEIINIAQAQVLYGSFLINNNMNTAVITSNDCPVQEAAVALTDLKQQNVLTNVVNNNTNQSNLQNENTNKAVPVENIQVVNSNGDKSKNIVEVKTENVLNNQNTVINSNTKDTSSLNNSLENTGEIKLVSNSVKSETENNVVFEKLENNNNLEEQKSKNVSTGFESALQTVQKTAQGDVIQVKVSDSVELNSDKAVNQLADKIIMRSDNEFDLQLNPKELGKIHIKVVFENGETKVSILCSTKQGMEALVGNTDKLASILENRTGNTTFVQVNHEEEQFYNQNYQQQEGRQQESAGEEKRNKRNKTEKSADFLEQMRLGLM